VRGCLALVAVVVAGCYEPPRETCTIRCTDTCPDGLVCSSQGYCVGNADDVCTTALTEVRIGARHACGLDATSGHLYCWGDDEFGAVGLGTGSDAVIAPTMVGDPSAVWSAVATGGDHTCAIQDGDVYCWGQNDHGESRGNAGGTQMTPQKVATSPTTPLPPGGFSQVAAGGEHSCAIGDGQLWCWGDPEAVGQDKSFMERIGTLDDWTEVSAGQNHVCGISTSMGILCFGKNDRGQLGQPDLQDRAAPTSLSNGPPAGPPLHVLAGVGYTCAIFGTAATDTMGELFCWGENGDLEITANNTINPVIAATMMGTTADWAQVTGGERRICGRRGGHAYCWGQTYAAGLGDGVFNEAIDVTKAADLGLADDVQLGAATRYDERDDIGCLTTDRQIKCWGDNAHGGVGVGLPANMSPRGIEVHAPNAHAWAHIVSGHHHLCGTTDNGELFCWGADDGGQVSGQPGRGGSSAPCLPTEPCNFALPQIAPVPHADQISAGNDYACALDGAALTCWGANDHGALGAEGDIVIPVPPPSGETWSRLMGGDRGNCATTASGKLYCWGYLYNNLSQEMPLEQTDADLAPAMLEMKIGDDFACGVRMDHTRICWGANDSYQLGIGTNIDVADPSFMNMLSYVDHISLRNDHVCAIGDTDQHVACWGTANDREHGSQNQQVMTPNAITDDAGTGLTGCSSVTTGDGTSCAVCAGKVQCWGEDYEDQLGRGTRLGILDEHAAPVALPDGMTFTEVVSGSSHACALSTDGRVFCWGYGIWGELGNGGKALPVPTLLAPAR
jgi:alpha-tubulin suppressor-like RCC1 family protein